MKSLTLALLLAAACGGKSANDPLSNHATGGGADFTPTTKAFPELANAQFTVIARDGRVIAYAMEGDTPRVLGTLTLPGPQPDEYSSFGFPAWWIDHDHLMVHGAADTEVWIVSTAGAALLAVPPDEHFASIPKPANDENGDEPDHGGSVTGMVGELWWDHCAWGYPADGFQCDVDAYVRIWPPDGTKKIVTTAPAKLGDIWRLDRKEVPAGFAITRDPDSNLPSCQDKGTTVDLPPSGEQSRAGDEHWFAGPAPGVLIEFGDYGMDDFVMGSFSIFDGCREAPVATGDSYTLLADGLWASADLDPANLDDNGQPKHRYVLRRNLEVVGELPEYSDVSWRPPASTSK